MRLASVLVVQHTPNEPPERLARWLADAGVLCDVLTPYDPAGRGLPGSLAGYSGLVVLGGPMGASDDDAAPWLPATRELLRAAVRERVPTLGICLGAQLLAVALGGRVRRGEAGPEVGPGLVAKRDAAAGDRLFRDVPFTPDVLQWHWDVISDLPPGGIPLASSTRYPNQAFAVSDRAWGLQFHVETTPETVRRWAAADAAALAAEGIDVDAVLARRDLDELHVDLEQAWRPVLLRFAELVREAEYAARS